MAIEYNQTLTISIQVTDWERSKQWYQDTLELKLQYEVPEIGWCELETGIPGTTLGLNRVDEIARGDSVIPTLGVKDLDAVRTALEAKGVEFLGDTETIEGMVKLAHFKDPDANNLCLAESLAEG